MNVKINIHVNNSKIEKRLELVNSWKVPEAVKKEIQKFIDDLALGKVNRGKKSSERNQVKYLTLLKVPLEFFNKPTSRLTEKDIDKFDKELSSGKISKLNGKEYAPVVKVDLRRALKIFLRWKLGEAKESKLAGWLDTRDIKKTPDYLKESEIVKLYKACKTIEEKYLIAVLFDSGARAEEFHNIRFEDIQLPEKNENFVKIALKEEYSKTLGRTISLYWPRSLEAVSDYLEERKKEGIKSKEQVFKKVYDSTRFILNRLGHKALGKSIHYHLFRHSSATHYAPKLNRQELCYRYGWKFSSDMPDVYISRSGMENKQLDEQFTNTELSDLQTKVAKMENIIKMMLEQKEVLKKVEQKL